MLLKLGCKSKPLLAVINLTEHTRQLQTGVGVGGEGYNGMLDCFRKIIKNEGASRLYRGITAPILMEAPKRSVTTDKSSLVSSSPPADRVTKGNKICSK